MKPVEVAHVALADVEAPRVALVVRGDRAGLVRRLSDSIPQAEIAVLDAKAGLDSLHLALAAGRPWDLVLDVAAGRVARRWQVLLHHVRRGGSLAVRLSGPARAVQQDVTATLTARAAGMAAPAPGRDHRRNSERDLAALGASTCDLRIEDGWLRATQEVATLAKVPELEADRVLADRPAAGRVLERLPGIRFDSRAVVRSSAPLRIRHDIEAPPMSLREYDDVTCLGRQAAYGDGFVLPESYRHPFKRRLRNVAFAEWAPRFVREPEPAEDQLEGPFFLLDSYVRGHFGHALTDQLGHVWGWSAAQARHPELRALLFAKPGESLAEWELDLLEAGGVPPDRVVLAHRPTRVDTLLCTSPMFGMPEYVHPSIATTYAVVGSALADRASTDVPGPLRIFCTRRPGKRTCHNASEVEALFADHGFTIVHPEDHSLPDQARLVRDAEVVAGFAGSGMFQIALAGGPKHVVLVGSESYTASNEYLISSVVGHRLDLVLCRPDVPRTGGFDNASYQSDFTFDHDREGVFLRSVLDELSDDGEQPETSLGYGRT